MYEAVEVRPPQLDQGPKVKFHQEVLIFCLVDIYKLNNKLNNNNDTHCNSMSEIREGQDIYTHRTYEVKI